MDRLRHAQANVADREDAIDEGRFAGVETVRRAHEDIGPEAQRLECPAHEPLAVAQPAIEEQRHGIEIEERPCVADVERDVAPGRQGHGVVGIRKRMQLRVFLTAIRLAEPRMRWTRHDQRPAPVAGQTARRAARRRAPAEPNF